MISDTRMTIHQPAAGLTLELAPFGHDELAQYFPFPDAYTRYAPIPKQAPQSVAEIMDVQTTRQHDIAWGIYVDRPSVESFVGVVSISKGHIGTVEKPARTTTVQEMHTGLFTEQWHGKGIGTLAKLAVASYAFAEQGTRAIYAQTSERNTAAQASLRKSGFAHLGSAEFFQFREKAQTQYWMLATPQAQQHMGEDQAALATGWNRYQAAHQTIDIRTNPGKASETSQI